jgi:intracellular sulfur oxidation DsrE/DsrF family protein
MNLSNWLRPYRVALLALTLGLGLAAQAQAADSAQPNAARFDFDHPTFAHDLPFAKHQIVLQVSVNKPAYWNLVLNNAQNLLDFFGQENVRVVVVAFGPGLPMLLKDSPVASRIESEDSEGVEFDACHNTMKAMARKIGHMPVLVPQAVVVPAGVVRIMQLEHAGFAYLRP